MEDKEILILIGKLRSKTISSEELKELQHILYSSQKSRKLLELMHDAFEDATELSSSLPEYKHKDLVKDRLARQISPRSQSRHKGRTNLLYWAISVSAACIIASFIFVSSFRKNVSHDIIWEVVSTKHGERKRVSLSDGTHILLNGNTSLTYPKHLINNLRLVKLDGEAFFDVAENLEKPFLIISKDFTTQVVGTSFNIDSDIGKVVEVNTGKVNVFAMSGNEVLLLVTQNTTEQTDILGQIANKSTNNVSLINGQRAQLDINSFWSISAYQYKNWFNNELIYLNEPMSQVIKKAYRNFGDSITVHPDLAQKNITITFRDKNKSQILNTLAELSGGTLTLNHKTKIWEIKK
ncbi:FecR family protein [Sphingobacterium pedocola]|uniref:FecR protein domain-containing protein n=1 Tax=Sphingobacterium pedocola TaxID=2082722 RepID=A0ABR9T866_9SPHI|nr:FecR family protein [Sphingobacterium pedocola]MBE8721495.1 hypothetical protein [Sphingobacterium pedocola]